MTPIDDLRIAGDSMKKYVAELKPIVSHLSTHEGLRYIEVQLNARLEELKESGEVDYTITAQARQTSPVLVSIQYRIAPGQGAGQIMNIDTEFYQDWIDYTPVLADDLLIRVKELTRIKLEPGEVLAVTISEDTGIQDMQNVHREFGKLFPNNKVVLLAGEFKFEGIKA